MYEYKYVCIYTYFGHPVRRLLLLWALDVGRLGLLALLGLHARVDLLERRVLAPLAVLHHAHEDAHELEHTQLAQQRHVQRPTRTDHQCRGRGALTMDDTVHWCTVH